MSSFIYPGDSKVKVNNFTTPRGLTFTGSGVSVTEDSANNKFTVTITAGSGSGETNTYSNAGLEGVGITLTKDDVDFPFKAIAAGSTKVTVTDDTDNKTVDIDVDEANLTLSNIGGTLSDNQLSSNIPLKDTANTFTAVQKIDVDSGQQITFYRPVNTAGFGAGFYYDFNDSTPSEQTYGNQYVSIEDNTAGSHRGDFNVQLAVSSSLGLRFRVFTSGDGGIIAGNNQYLLLSETGQTSQHTFTFPDATTEIVGDDTTQTLSSKTITAPVFDSFIEMDRITAPSDPSSNKSRLYVKQIDTNNDGIFYKIKKNGAFVEGQII